MMKFEEFFSQVDAPDSALWKGKPHGSIQWKGTNVCADLYCECGAQSHVDAEFFYGFACVYCGRKYAVSPNVALIPLNEEQIEYQAAKGCGFIGETINPDSDVRPDQP